jgi:hypothetical protein
MTNFLTLLPDILSQYREKTRLYSSMTTKMMMNDVTTGFASETFDVMGYPHSK